MSWQIFLQNLNGKTQIISDVSGRTTIDQFRVLVIEKTGIPGQELRLVFAGKELGGLNPGMTLEDLGMSDHSQVFALLRLRGGSSFQVTVASQSFGDVAIVSRADMSYEAFELKVLQALGKPELKGKIRILRPDGSAMKKLKTLRENAITKAANVEVLFKWLDPNVDLKVVLTEDPDSATYESAPGNPRAKLPCGHCFTPQTLTVQAKSLIEQQLRVEIPCLMGGGSGGCGRVIDYKYFKLAAKLDPDEIAFFEQKLSRNYASGNPNICECPKCNKFCWRDDINLAHVACPYCKIDKKTTEFCFYCLRPWKGASGAKDCGNKECRELYFNTMQKLLKDPSQQKTIHEVKNVPVYRACPNPKHAKGERPYPIIFGHHEACKHMKCPSCKLEFCWVCLREKLPSGWQCGAYNAPCDVAPPQSLEEYQQK